MRLLLAIGIFVGVVYWQFGLLETNELPQELQQPPKPAAGTPSAAASAKRARDSFESQLQPGRINVFVVTGQWCPACRKLEKYIKRFVGLRPDVAFKFVELNDRLAAEQNVATIPHVAIYDASGKQLATDAGDDKTAYKMLYRWMNDETKRAWKARR